MTNNAKLNRSYYRLSTLKPSETSLMFEQIHSGTQSLKLGFPRALHKACTDGGDISTAQRIPT